MVLSGRLIAVLTRSLDVRRLNLAEDAVQAALVQALKIWSRRGVPRPELLSLLIDRTPTAHVHERAAHPRSSAEQGPEDPRATVESC